MGAGVGSSGLPLPQSQAWGVGTCRPATAHILLASEQVARVLHFLRSQLLAPAAINLGLGDRNPPP